MDLLIRRMMYEDIPAGMELKTLAHWNQTVADWRVFLDANADGCFAAVCDGRVVGTTTVIRYGRSLAWIAMVLVHPEYRSRGIATTLMRKALDHSADCPTVMLDATAAGKNVYEKLGFIEGTAVQRWTTKTLTQVKGEPDAAASIADAEWEAIAELDRLCFCGDRTFLLDALRKNAPEMALALTRRGRIAGYCFGRRGTEFVQIGPLVSENREDALGLSLAALHRLTGRAVVFDVPSAHVGFIQWLEGSGFSLQRDFVRMIRGKKGKPQAMDRQFAICGPDFG